MLNHRRVGKPGVRAPEMFRNRRVQPRKALRAAVDHRRRHGRRATYWTRRRRVGYHDTERHGRERVRGVWDVVGFLGVVQDRTRVVDAAGDRAAVGSTATGRVEPSTGGRIPPAVDAETVALFGADPLDEDRPDAIVMAVDVVVGCCDLRLPARVRPALRAAPQPNDVPPSRMRAPRTEVSRGTGNAADSKARN